MLCVLPLNAFCRLCLDVDVKVHKLSTAHAVLVEKIFKLKVIDFVDVDIQCNEQYVCSICLALLSKTNNFVQMIFRAQNLLDDIMETTDVITKPMLKSIDRHINGLNPLSVRVFGIFDEDEKLYGVDPRDSHEKTDQIKSIDIKKSKQERSNLKYINKTKNDVENVDIEISTNTEEDIQEPLIDVSLENESKEMGNDPHEENLTFLVSGNNKTKNNSPDPHNNNTPHYQNSIPKKRKTKVDSESSNFSKTESSKSSVHENKLKKKKKNKRDPDYQPDSTSEDSDFVFYKHTRKQHMKPKGPERVYPRQCDHCDYEVPKKCDHYRHYLYEHPNLKFPYPSSDKLYPCSFCGKLKTDKAMKQHESLHIIGEHKCPLCPKVFTCRRRMTKHKNRIHGNHIYMCDFCSKSFKSRAEIVRHIRIHTGEKPFKCHICGAGFAHSGNRIVHIRSAHQNIRYFPKKRKQNKIVRRNQKHNLTDTDSEYHSGEEIVRKRNTKKIRKNKRQLQSDTEMKPANEKQSKRKIRTKNKFQCKKVAYAGIESGDAKQNDKRNSNKGASLCRKRNNTEQPIGDCKSDNLIETDVDSDDECLAEKKKKQELDDIKIALNTGDTATESNKNTRKKQTLEQRKTAH